MRKAFLVAFLVASLSVVRAEDIDESDVIVLTESNFDAEVMTRDLILVEFYAPWCGHCKALTPNYAAAATELSRHDPPIPLAKLDATVHGKVAGKYGISGYPTLKVFRNGKESDYKGPRETKGIVAYMKKQAGPAAKQLDSVEAVEAFIKSDPETGFALVGFFDQAKSTSSQLYSSFALLANRLRDAYVFAKVFDASVAKHYGVEQDSIVAFKNFDDKKTVYAGSSSTKELEDWIKRNSVALVGEYTSDNQDAYQRRGLPIVKLFLSMDRASNPKQFDFYVNRLRKAADKFRDQLAVVFAKMADFEHDVSMFGFKGKEWGLMVERNYDARFKFEGKYSADNLIKFFKDVLDEKVAKWVRSEDVPEEEWQPGKVKVVVGKTFVEDVLGASDKDVMIEFYAPWCGHCKALEPKYNELAAKLKKEPNVVIAKIDATANDFPREKFEVSGYPSIFLVPAKKNARPIKYEGGREVEDMLKFIRKKGKAAKPTKKSKKAKKRRVVDDDDEDEL